VETFGRRDRCAPNGSDVKLRGQGPRAEADAAHGVHACESRDAGRAPPTRFLTSRGGSAAGPKPGRASFYGELGAAWLTSIFSNVRGHLIALRTSSVARVAFGSDGRLAAESSRCHECVISRATLLE